MLETKVIGTFNTFSKLSTISDANENASSEQMLKDLLADQKVMLDHLKKAMDESDGQNDIVTADIITSRIVSHEKNSWVIRSHLS